MDAIEAARSGHRSAPAARRSGRAPRALALSLLAALLALPAAPAASMAQDPSEPPALEAPASEGADPLVEDEEETVADESPAPSERRAARRGPATAAPVAEPQEAATTEEDPTPDPTGAPSGETAPADPDPAPGPNEEEPATTVIVTLAVPDAARSIDPASRAGRERARTRAQRSRRATRGLEADYGFQATQRYEWALGGFAAELTPRQIRQLRNDPQVASVRPARRFRIAAQTLPAGLKRVSGEPASGPPIPDVDVDVAVIDTGIGPVGGGELNVVGGENCSGDNKREDAWEDLYPSRHGTHVGGIIGARHNGIGIVGVAPGARLWSLRVFDRYGYGDETTVLCALDWVVRTHGLNPPKGSQPIEVVNMSLVGPAVPNTPSECNVFNDPDPSHVAVCSAVAAGVTVVVAAGNAAANAKAYSPASYDQVVTVAAISDFDGLPGGLAKPTCGSTAYGAETDDTYARYSNRGSVVDIVAPGTCVLSTVTSTDGRATQRMSGTSMATPFVAGAAARYLAANPGTSPERMRQLLIASGDTDWDVKTDPDWKGAASGAGPKRLLDVAALAAAQPGIALWTTPNRATLSTKAPQPSVRVDLQRIGGYDGPVTLGVNGLGGGTSAAWQPAAPLTGLAGLGSRLTLSAMGGTEDGTISFDVTGGGSGSVAATRSAKLRVDRTPPAISGPKLRLLPRVLGAGNTAPMSVSWAATDAGGSVRKAVMQRSISGSAWKTVASSPAGGSTTLQVPPRQRTGLRVRATDSVGNVGTKGLETRLAVLDPASGGFDLSGSWRTRSASSALKGNVVVSSSTGASMRTTFKGRSVGVVAPVGPGGGEIKVRVDGGPWARVKLSRSSRQAKRIVYGRALSAGTHTLEIRVTRAPATLDALVVLR
jgi:subtilisin